MVESAQRAARPYVPAAALVVAAIVISGWVAQFAAWACVSGEEASGSLEAGLCTGFAGSFRSLTWWVAVLWPGIVFGVSQMLPALRRRPMVIAICLGVGGIAFWFATAIAVIDMG